MNHDTASDLNEGCRFLLFFLFLKLISIAKLVVFSVFIIQD